MKTIISAILNLIVLTVVTGLAYPLLITGIAGIAFPEKSAGSMIKSDGKIIGSELIGQKFTSPRYFWSRPSAIDNNPMPSGGSNLSPDSKALKDIVQARLDTIKKYHNVRNFQDVPQDLLFASASGIDPHISPEAARFQIERIAKAWGLSQDQNNILSNLVVKSIEEPQLGFLGEPRVNVLKLNLLLDKTFGIKSKE